jgi:hypothetical protein
MVAGFIYLVVQTRWRQFARKRASQPNAKMKRRVNKNRFNHLKLVVNPSKDSGKSLDAQEGEGSDRPKTWH